MERVDSDKNCFADVTDPGFGNTTAAVGMPASPESDLSAFADSGNQKSKRWARRDLVTERRGRSGTFQAQDDGDLRRRDIRGVLRANGGDLMDRTSGTTALDQLSHTDALGDGIPLGPQHHFLLSSTQVGQTTVAKRPAGH